MTVVYILLGLFTIFVFGYGAKTMIRSDELDEYREELDKYSVHLDERAHKLAADEATVRQLYKELRKELNKRKDNGQ